MIDVGSIDRLRLGDHACVVVDDDVSHTRSVAAYIRAGLRDRHRILYYGGGHGEIRAELALHGVDADEALAAGHLRMTVPEESYLASGFFDPEATIAAWRDESAIARAEGYQGLRSAGDMAWGLRSIPGADRLDWYERNVNRVFADGFAMGLCLYDRRRFPAAALELAASSHPATIDSGTSSDDVPLLRAVRTTSPRGIRLEGEVDMSNRRALSTLMRHLAEDTPGTGDELVVDVSGLRFIDVTAVGILLRAAADGNLRFRVVGCAPSTRHLLAFSGAGTVPGLTVEAAS